MAKYCGVIGFATSEETAPGVWKEVITERTYYGDVTRSRANVQQSSVINASITISNEISIIADPFAYEHFYAMRYISWIGKKWTITSVEIEHPRLRLGIGGLYNGQ